MRAHQKPLLGLAYLLVLALLVAFSIQAYRKALPWQDTASVTLTTTTPGLELNPQSDVKLQGMRVGEVRRITSDGSAATVELALDPDKLDLIPANVDAAIVPKTLFGEKFVDLRVPAAASPQRLAAGGVIRQSTTSVEIGRLFSQLVPLLRAIEPEKLSVVLSSLAEALDGRGATLARTLSQLQGFLDATEPHLGTLAHDIRQFARTATLYADSAPEIADILSASAGISGQLLVPQEQQLADFLDSVIGTSAKAQQVLETNTERLVTLSGRSRPVLALLDDYSSSLGCFINGLHTADVLANQATGNRGPFVNLTIDMITHNKPYVYPDDLPSNPKSDAHNSNLPLPVPDWDPHCPQFSAEVHALEQAPPYSQPMPAVPLHPVTAQGATTRDNQAMDAIVADARAAMARAIAAQLLDTPQDEVPSYAGLLLDPLLSGGKVTLP